MAFTEAQRIKIADILGITPDILYYHLTSGAFELTSAKQTAIEAKITLWDAGPGAVTEYAKLHPKESNKGVETDPDKDANTLRSSIARMLERLDWATSSTSYEFEMVRG